jgi:plastocyanin
MALSSVAHPADDQTPARGPSDHLAHHGDITSVDDVAARAYSATVVINTVGLTWSPNDVTIQVGDSVMWNANFSFHPLRQVDGPNSDTPPPGGFAYSGLASSFTYQFNSAGTFYYQCSNHGLAQFGGAMRGRIVVLAASGTNTVTPTSTPTATGTLAPSTSTPTPTITPTATDTFVPSTNTPTPTGALPSPTSTPTATGTPVKPQWMLFLPLVLR